MGSAFLPEALAQTNSAAIGQSELAGLRLRVMFQGQMESGFSHTEAQTARFAALLGREPGKYSYAEELVKHWRP